MKAPASPQGVQPSQRFEGFSGSFSESRRSLSDKYLGKPIMKAGLLMKEGKTLMKSEADFRGGVPHKVMVDLRDCSLATAEQHTSKPFSFGIFHTKRRDYFFDASEERDMLKWISKIERILGVRENDLTLEDFELLSLVGKGAYGRVLQVRKKDNGAIYAMKVLNKEDLVTTNQVPPTSKQSATKL